MAANDAGPTKSLQQAATEGDVEQIKRHLAANSDFGAPDSYGIMPLNQVIMRNHPEAAKLIIESGKADLNKPGRDGKTPLMLAAGMRDGAKETVEALLAKDVDVKAKDGFDETALFAAVRGGNKDVVELLVKRGADVNAVSRNAQTPYTMALESPPRPEIAEFLKQNGAKAAATNALSPYGNSPYAGAQPGLQGPGGAGRRPIIQVDPNEIQKKVKQFEGLAVGIKAVDDKSDNEVRGWTQRRTDNRTVLYSAEEQQFADELAFIKPIAVAEKAAKTAKAIDDLTARRKKRADLVSEQLRDQRRATTLQNRQTAGGRGARGGRGGQQAVGGAGATPYNPGSTYGGASPYTGTATRGLANQPAADPNTQAQIQAWLGAKPEDKRALLQAVSDLNLSELQALDELATKEQALKTSAAILSFMMLRDQRVGKITLAWQEDDARLQKLQSMPGRGPQGNQQQQQGQQGMRGGRRGR